MNYNKFKNKDKKCKMRGLERFDVSFFKCKYFYKNRCKNVLENSHCSEIMRLFYQEKFVECEKLLKELKYLRLYYG